MKKAQLLAKEEIGEDFECKFNTNETFILCWSINKEAQQDKPLKYFVYEISEEQIIHENVIPRGDVDWTSESEILVKTIPGLLKEDESLRDYSYVFDVKRKTKINKKRP